MFAVVPHGQVQALADLSTATSLRVLRVRRFQTLQVKARPALPRELTNLQQLAVLILDCDLHLRDVQVSQHFLDGEAVAVLPLTVTSSACYDHHDAQLPHHVESKCCSYGTRQHD